MTLLSQSRLKAPVDSNRLSRALRIVGLIISSVYFFPISCTTTILPTISVIAALDARDLSEGDERFPYTSFNVIVYMPRKTPSFSVESLESLEHYEKQKALKETFPNLSLGLSDDFTFLLPEKAGKLLEDDRVLSSPGRCHLVEHFGEESLCYYKYTVEQLAPSKQLIDVWFRDDDVSVLSRYIAEEGAITPVYAKRLMPGFMFGAFPYALGFAFLIRGGGVALVRRNSSTGQNEKIRSCGVPNFTVGALFLLIALVNSWHLFI